MGYYPKPSSPRALIADIRAFAKQRSAVQWGVLATAIIMPIAMIVLFITDGNTNIQPGPRLIYAESWKADRSDAEIIADQKRDQAIRDAAIKERQRQFQKVEKKMDDLGL